MKPGDIVLAELAQSNNYKLRPALILKTIPPFDDFLLCGISTRLELEVVGLDYLMLISDSEARNWGLTQDSLLRLGFLGLVSRTEIKGRKGRVSPEFLADVRSRLTRFIEADD